MNRKLLFVHPLTHCVIMNFNDHSRLFSIVSHAGNVWNPVSFSCLTWSSCDRQSVKQFSISSLFRCSFSIHAEQRRCSAVWGQSIWGWLPLLVCWSDCSERSVSFLITAQKLKGHSIGQKNQAALFTFHTSGALILTRQLNLLPRKWHAPSR